MIKTIKDAEIQIGILQRQVTDLQKQIKRLSSSIQSNGASVHETNGTEVRNLPQFNDEEIVVDENLIKHKFNHRFRNLSVQDLFAEVATLDEINSEEIHTKYVNIVRPGQYPHLHISDADNDKGLYVFNYADDDAFFTIGAYFNGSAWVAKDTKASFFSISAGGLNFWHTTGLTPGNTFSPIHIMTWDNTGKIYLTSIIANGNGGVTQGPLNRVTAVSPTTNNINYKDHAGANQTMSVVTAVNVTVSSTDAYNSGIKIA